MKFVAVPEDKAKAITASLVGSRTIQMTFRFSRGKSSLKKSFYGGPDLITEAKVTSATLGRGDEAFEVKL